MGQSLQISQFAVGDLALINPREFEAREMMLLGNFKERAAAYIQAGPAFTGFYDGEIMACCGIAKIWKGSGYLWAITTSLAASKPLSFHRAISQGIERLRVTMGLWRLETAIHQDHIVSQLWIQRLGLKYEGHAPGFGPDKSTYIRFGRYYG